MNEPQLTKREYFAILALQALIGVENDPLCRVLIKSRPGEVNPNNPETSASIKVQAAIVYADALIEQMDQSEEQKQ